MTPRRLRLAAALSVLLVLGSALFLWVFGRSLETSYRARVDWRPNLLLARDAGTGERISLSSQPDPSGRLREWVPLEDIPPSVVDTVLTIEDRRFYEHRGVDFRRIVGAALANLRAGRIREGASTITQQLVRTVHLDRERTLARKLREILGAWLLERRHGKDEILEAYLNEIYLAQDGATAIHGVALASRHSFGKPLADLSLSESALLAGMIRAPSVFSPRRDLEAATRRRDQVIGILLERGRISEAESRSARREELEAPPRLAPDIDATHFVAYAERELEALAGSEAVARGGFRALTTLDPRIQRIAGRALRTGLTQLETLYPELRREESPLQAALVVVDPRTGGVLALVGGRDVGGSSFDRATAARRQPGSAFKPILALAALTPNAEGTVRYTLASVIDDSPLRVESEYGQRAWQPSNHDGIFRGPVTLRDSLQRSLNVPIARLGLEIGLESIIETAQRLGVESRLAPMPSLTLGAFEVTPLELTHAYSVFAAGGMRARLHGIETLAAPGEEARASLWPAPVRVADAGAVHLVTSALQGAADRGSAAPLRAYGYMGAVAGKTGTSDDARDGWFLSYTPEMAVGVWVGFDDGTALGHAAYAMALPISARFLRATLGRHSGAHFLPPAGVVRARVEVPLGEHCLRTTEWFLAGSVPGSRCEDVETPDFN